MKKKNNLFIFFLVCAAAFSVNAQSWSLTGNSGTNSNTHFIGTRDSWPLTFRTNNIPRLYISGYGGLTIMDPGSQANNSHPILLYGEKHSQGPGIYINGFSTTSGSSMILGISRGSGAGIQGQAGQAGSAGVYGDGGGSGNGVKAYAYHGAAMNASSYYNFGLYAATSYATYAAYFNRSIFVNGGYYSSSDQKLKQGIKDVSNAMAIINQLHPKKYHYRQDGPYKLMKLPQEEQYGLVAQEVEQVLPGLVKDTQFDTALEAATPKPDKNGIVNLPQSPASEIIKFKALNYMGLIPVMIKGMQEQQAQIQQQQEKIKSQDEKIEQLSALVEQLLSSRSLHGNTGLFNREDDSNSASLTQNAPNPFHQTTTIRYYVPQQAGKAHIQISDMSGKLITTYPISAKGTGQLVIEGGQLSPGSYQYTLFINGQAIDTKKLVLIK